MRAATRRWLHQPRPTATPQDRYRKAVWKARVIEQQKARQLTKGAHRYAFELIEVPTVQHGVWSLFSDQQMAERLGFSKSTAKRHRLELIEHGLIENPGQCLTRPVLKDGPVFPGAKATISDPPARSKMVTNKTSLTEVTESSSPPLTPPVEPEPPREGEVNLVSEVKAKAETPQPITLADFTALWLASGQIGNREAAFAQWKKLPPAVKILLDERARAGGINTGGIWLASWLELRGWEVVDKPAPKPLEGFSIDPDSKEGAEWRDYWRARGEPTSRPVDRTGRWVRRLPSRWPPGHQPTKGDTT